MIFMETHQLGWKPMKTSFIASLPPAFTDEQKSLLDDLFDWLVPGCLKVLPSYTLYIKFSEVHLFRCLVQLFSAVIGVQKLKEGKEAVDTIYMQMVFLFSVLWGLCSSLTKEGKPKFDIHFRNLLDGLVKGHSKPISFKLARSNLYPETGNVFEYMLNPDNPTSWCTWQDQVQRRRRGIL